MDMVGKIRWLHSRGKKSEREIARMTRAIAKHRSKVVEGVGRRTAEVPASVGAGQAGALRGDRQAGAGG